MINNLDLGIKLPILFDFEQINSEVHFERDKLWIGADYCFEDSCKRAVTTNSNNADKIGQSKDMDVNYYDAAE